MSNTDFHPSAAEFHHRHPTTGYQNKTPDASVTSTSTTTKDQDDDEGSPLIAPHNLIRHMSMEGDYIHTSFRRDVSDLHQTILQKIKRLAPPLRVLVVLMALMCLLGIWLRRQHNHYFGIPFFSNNHGGIRTIHHAHEKYITVDSKRNLQLWYRTWGNPNGIPLLFVHGGPGNAVEDYNNGNQRFFDYRTFYVIEVDQRGTGKSKPSVRESWHNMKYYDDISIDLIAADFEVIRQAEEIERWVVWGGSFGSTLSINYGTRYPERCLALIIRGIYLDTEPEIEAVYNRNSYLNNPKRLAEFEILYNYAADTVQKMQDDPTNMNKDMYKDTNLDPNDGERLLQIYADRITSGDQLAIWHWHVFENNLMEEDPANLLDPNVIDKAHFREAQSVAYFETRLWLHGSYESPSNLMDRIDQLAVIPKVWICQGLRDEVCPAKYAKSLTIGFDQYDVNYNAHFVDGGHEDSDPVIEKCLKNSIYEYTQQYGEQQQTHKQKKNQQEEPQLRR